MRILSVAYRAMSEDGPSKRMQRSGFAGINTEVMAQMHVLYLVYLSAVCAVCGVQDCVKAVV